ncbi:hypothetical protein PoB_003460300 [Plakobranchus ocellatus]|uniref:Uncharacterized protein n=1 Tax=Plakobranchus ocellatus TaxID=259542 RepID=A0AAV4ANF7_9GAST|nr:hypothetical protein PoB_003460300 [Plakobranchus ocellatus]
MFKTCVEPGYSYVVKNVRLTCRKFAAAAEWVPTCLGCDLPQEKKCLDYNSIYQTSCGNYTCLWDSRTARAKLHKTLTGKFS